ncbi:RNA-directed DNA polymerase from mobile element jockey-like [Brachionus plicatilis]|uniref:RNA-directed DNA polymerase from mobile element jockey-like n=1 Tax=Brachionus plicatilis TaxID=10195 RepID=A0A3M7PVY7_BRAPC|nr:RNA-directed DNA polymerase from mobile element jockey-like [Brachionus plicatilis]
MFKLAKGINVVEWVNPPVLANSLSLTGPARGIRGHARRLSGQASIKCLQRENTFTNRVVNEWNALPASFVNATSVNQFKNRYDAVRVLSNYVQRATIGVLSCGTPPQASLALYPLNLNLNVKLLNVNRFLVNQKLVNLALAEKSLKSKLETLHLVPKGRDFTIYIINRRIHVQKQQVCKDD